jgi:hypothetical protein
MKYAYVAIPPVDGAGMNPDRRELLYCCGVPRWRKNLRMLGLFRRDDWRDCLFNEG